jgi:endoglucanase
MIGTFETGPSYACEQNGGYGFSDTPIGDSLYSPMVSWKINSNAIFLNQDCWLGINGANPTYSGQNYINFVKNQVASMEKYGIIPVLVFGEGAPGSQQPNWGATDTGEAPMPDNDHMPLAVQQLANTFKNDPNVIFRLYEEPWPNNTGTDLTTWKCWSKGDVQYDASGSLTPISQNQNCNETYNGTPYKSVGMQSLLNIIRGTGATNIVQVPGVAFANMLACSATGDPNQCGFLDSTDGVRVNDTLNPAQLMADTDNYPDAGQYCGDLTCLNGSYDKVRQVMPLDIGEAGVFGANNNSFPLIQQFINQYDTWGQSYYGSQWESWANMISDYNGTPAAGWGVWLHSHITGQ